MSTTQRIREYSKLILLIIVIPVLATVVFSKFVTSIDLFAKSEAFSIRDSFAAFAEVECSQDKCQSPKLTFEGLDVFRSLNGRITFKASPDQQPQIEDLRKKMIDSADQYIDTPLCLNNPGSFATNLLIKNYEKEFITAELKKELYDIVFLTKGADEKVIKERSGPICKKIVGLLRAYFVSDLNPTQEPEIKKLKLVLGFYLALTFLALFAFYLYPQFKNRFK